MSASRCFASLSLSVLAERETRPNERYSSQASTREQSPVLSTRTLIPITTSRCSGGVTARRSPRSHPRTCTRSARSSHTPRAPEPGGTLGPVCRAGENAARSPGAAPRIARSEPLGAPISVPCHTHRDAPRRVVAAPNTAADLTSYCGPRHGPVDPGRARRFDPRPAPVEEAGYLWRRASQTPRDMRQVKSVPVSLGAGRSFGCSPTNSKPRRRGMPALATFALS